jgi:hypothetical protein
MNKAGKITSTSYTIKMMSSYLQGPPSLVEKRALVLVGKGL